MDALNSFASGGLTDIVAFVGNFLIFLVIGAVLFFLALRTGRNMLVSLVLALYIGFAFFTVFPFKETLIFGDTAFVRALSGIALFAVFTAFPYILIRRVSTAGSLRINPIALAILAFAAGGLVLVLGYHVLNIAAVLPLTPSLDALFAPEQYFFWWFLAPLIGIYLTAR